MPIQTFRSYGGWAKETTWGTGVSPATTDQFILGYSSMKPADELDPIIDQGFRGTASQDYGYYQGFRMGKFGLDILPYPQHMGHAFMGMMGTDTITGAGPYSHAFTMLDTGLPPSYSVTDFDGMLATAKQFSGCYFESLTFSYSSTGAIKMAVSLIGKTSAPVTAPTSVFAADNMFLPYQNVFNLAGGTNLKLISLELKMSRKWEPIFGAGGTQDLTAGSLGPMEVTGKCTFAPTDQTELNYYLNNTQPAFSALFTSGANTLTIQMTKCAFDKASVIDRGSTFAKVTSPIRGIRNVTDAGPIKITIANTKSAAY